MHVCLFLFARRDVVDNVALQYEKSCNIQKFRASSHTNRNRNVLAVKHGLVTWRQGALLLFIHLFVLIYLFFSILILHRTLPIPATSSLSSSSCAASAPPPPPPITDPPMGSTY